MRRTFTAAESGLTADHDVDAPCIIQADPYLCNHHSHPGHSKDPSVCAQGHFARGLAAAETI